MTTCSTLIIIRKYPEYAVFGLIGVVITQALGYGLIFDLNFFLRNLSVMGGLLMVLSDSWVRKKFAPAGLPLPAEKDRKKYIQLAGRILLILLFVGFIWSGDWGIVRILVSVSGLIACVMVVVGFKAKWSAILLVVILSVFNLLVNNFWTVRITSLSNLSCCKLTMTHSYMSTIHIKTSPNMTSSRYCRLCKYPRVAVAMMPLDILSLTIPQRRSTSFGQHGSWLIQCRREEKSLLARETPI